MLRFKLRLRKLADNQDGLVAIVVTLLIMLVLTLIITGFAQLARKEQRESLDRQLSTQALFAAESGVNDARRIIDAKKLANENDYEKDTCASGGDEKLDGDLITYSCLLIKQKLEDIIFSPVGLNKSSVTPIVPEDKVGHIFDRLTIGWHNYNGSKTIRDTNDFGTKANDWASTEVGMLRLELVPHISIAAPQTAETLREGTFTFFVRPKKTFAAGDGQVAYSTDRDAQGKIVDADCSGAATEDYACRVTITNLINKNYYLRVRAIYNTASFRACPGSTAVPAGCDEEIKLKDAQVEIDSTGRANDVLKRIKVRMPKTPLYDGTRDTAEYTLDSAEDICKTYSIYPGGVEGAVCP